MTARPASSINPYKPGGSTWAPLTPSIKMTESLDRAIGRLEGKVDGLSERLVHVEADVSQIEARTRGLENWRWKVTGIAAAVSGFIAVLVRIL